MQAKQLTEEFLKYKGQLKSFVFRLTANTADAEDIVQDTYVKASEKIDTFRSESTLKTWIFTIASNLAKDNLRAKRRWTEDVTDRGKAAALADQAFFEEAMQIRMTSPQGAFEIKEHIAFCFTCIGKSLPLEQQISILLKEVYGFKVNEITEIMGVNEGMVKYYLHTGRAKMINIFEGRCALINKKGVCHQCTELNGIFNPKQDQQEELNKIEMVKQAGIADKEHLFNLRLQIVAGIDIYESPATELQLHHYAHNSRVMENYLKKNED